MIKPINFNELCDFMKDRFDSIDNTIDGAVIIILDKTKETRDWAVFGMTLVDVAGCLEATRIENNEMVLQNFRSRLIPKKDAASAEDGNA